MDIQRANGLRLLQVTVDADGYLVPSADIFYVNRLDVKPSHNLGTKLRPQFHRILLILLVAEGGIEPPTYGL